MSVFEKYSIEEISKRTKISPISLKYIKNKEFDKIPRVKFIGFIRLIEREFNVDLSEIINEYDSNTISEPKKIKKKPTTSKNKNNYTIIIFAIIILILGSILLYKQLPKDKNIKINPTKIVEKNISKKIKEKNETTVTIPPKPEPLKISEENTTTITTQAPKKEKNLTIVVIPHKKLWYRAVNLDTNKSKEFLTTKTKEFKGNYFMKFGHGDFTILYGDYNITPNTKKIVRILFKDGNYTFVKRKK